MSVLESVQVIKEEKEQTKFMIPLPICGIALGFAALGNLLNSFSSSLHVICGIASFAIIIAVMLSVVLQPQVFLSNMKNPMILSGFGAFPMVCMLLSTYIKPYFGKLALLIWSLAIIAHVLLLLYFTANFIFHIDYKTVYVSYYLIYTGIAMVAVTAPEYNMLLAGRIALIVAAIGTLFVSILLLIRQLNYPEKPEHAKPLSCMLTAPFSLLLVGYLKSMQSKSTMIIISLLLLSWITYLFSLKKLIKCIRLPFFPSCAAFSFPFVISTMASKMTAGYFENMHYNTYILSSVVTAMTILASFIVLYTFVFYIKNGIQLTQDAKTAKK